MPSGTTISTNTTWYAADSPYILLGGVSIAAGVQLTIQPGVQVEFAQGGYIYVAGTAHLVAAGTAASQITFGSSLSNPTTGQYWQYLLFDTGSYAQLSYCNISQAGYSGAYPVDIRVANVQVNNCTIQNNSTGGVYLEGTGNAAQLQNLTIQNNAGPAVLESTIDMEPSLNNISMSGNSPDGVTVGAGALYHPVTLNGGSQALHGSPFWLPAVTMNPGSAITVTPGTTLRLALGDYITVESGTSLMAQGLITEPITFTNEVSGQLWDGIYVYAGGHLRLSHCDLGYAGSGGYHPLQLNAADVQVSNCRIHDNNAGGVNLEGTGNAAVLQNLTIQNNAGPAILEGTIDMVPSFKNITMSGNAPDGVTVSSANLYHPITLNGSPQALHGSPFWLPAVLINTGARSPSRRAPRCVWPWVTTSLWRAAPA